MAPADPLAAGENGKSVVKRLPSRCIHAISRRPSLACALLIYQRMNKPTLLPRPAAAVLLVALCATTAVPIQTAHANRRTALAQRVTPVTTGAAKARSQQWQRNRRTKLRAGAATAFAKPSVSKAVAPRKKWSNKSQYSIGAVAVGGAITALFGGLSLKMASITLAVVGEAFASSEPALALLAVGTGVVTFLGGWLTGILGKGVVQAAREIRG